MAPIVHWNWKYIFPSFLLISPPTLTDINSQKWFGPVLWETRVTLLDGVKEIRFQQWNLSIYGQFNGLSIDSAQFTLGTVSRSIIWNERRTSYQSKGASNITVKRRTTFTHTKNPANSQLIFLPILRGICSPFVALIGVRIARICEQTKQILHLLECLINWRDIVAFSISIPTDRSKSTEIVIVGNRNLAASDFMCRLSYCWCTRCNWVEFL